MGNTGSLPRSLMVGERRLRPVALLGEGGFSHVYIAQDEYSGEMVVLKRARVDADNDENVSIARTEIHILETLAPHANIVPCLGQAETTVPGGASGNQAGSAVVDFDVLLSLCHGGTVASELAGFAGRGEPMPEARVLARWRDLARGCAHLHAQSPPVSHRDIKLENLLLAPTAAAPRGAASWPPALTARDVSGAGDPNGAWYVGRLCDFGSAAIGPQPVRSEAEAAAAEGLLDKTTTLAYRAPELCDTRLLSLLIPHEQRHTRALGPPADVWSLGCALYQLAFGRMPFEDPASGVPSRIAILNGRFRLPPQHPYSAGLCDLIRACLVVDPRQRPTVPEVLRRAESLAAWPPEAPDLAAAPAAHSRHGSSARSAAGSIPRGAAPHPPGQPLHFSGAGSRPSRGTAGSASLVGESPTATADFSPVPAGGARGAAAGARATSRDSEPQAVVDGNDWGSAVSFPASAPVGAQPRPPEPVTASQVGRPHAATMSEVPHGLGTSANMGGAFGQRAAPRTSSSGGTSAATAAGFVERVVTVSGSRPHLDSDRGMGTRGNASHPRSLSEASGMVAFDNWSESPSHAPQAYRTQHADQSEPPRGPSLSAMSPPISAPPPSAQPPHGLTDVEQFLAEAFASADGGGQPSPRVGDRTAERTRAAIAARLPRFPTGSADEPTDIGTGTGNGGRGVGLPDDGSSSDDYEYDNDVGDDHDSDLRPYGGTTSARAGSGGLSLSGSVSSGGGRSGGVRVMAFTGAGAAPSALSSAGRPRSSSSDASGALSKLGLPSFRSPVAAGLGETVASRVMQVMGREANRRRWVLKATSGQHPGPPKGKYVRRLVLDAHACLAEDKGKGLQDCALIAHLPRRLASAPSSVVRLKGAALALLVCQQAPRGTAAALHRARPSFAPPTEVSDAPASFTAYVRQYSNLVHAWMLAQADTCPGLSALLGVDSLAQLAASGAAGSGSLSLARAWSALGGPDVTSPSSSPQQSVSWLAGSAGTAIEVLDLAWRVEGMPPRASLARSHGPRAGGPNETISPAAACAAGSMYPLLAHASAAWTAAMLAWSLVRALGQGNTGDAVPSTLRRLHTALCQHIESYAALSTRPAYRELTAPPDALRKLPPPALLDALVSASPSEAPVLCLRGLVGSSSVVMSASAESAAVSYDTPPTHARSAAAAPVSSTVLSESELLADPGPVTEQTLQACLRRIRGTPGNDRCAECGDRLGSSPWASINLGVLFCLRCSGAHRGVGVHVSQVRSLGLDAWRPAWARTVAAIGNARASAYWEAGPVPPGAKPTPDSPLEALGAWVRAKYDHRAYARAGSLPPHELLAARLIRMEQPARADPSAPPSTPHAGGAWDSHAASTGAADAGGAGSSLIYSGADGSQRALQDFAAAESSPVFDLDSWDPVSASSGAGSGAAGTNQDPSSDWWNSMVSFDGQNTTSAS